MQLRTLTALLATGLVGVQAAPAATTEDVLSGLNPVYARVVDKGIISYYSAGPVDFDFDNAWKNPVDFDAVAASAPAVQKRCGSNQVHCASDNLARSSVCENFTNSLIRNPGVPIDIGVGAILYSEGTFNCVIRWEDRVANMVQGYLIGAAQATLRRCGAGVTVSGWVTDVSLNNVCTTQKMFA